MRATTTILPGEDSDAFDARLEAWTADLDPRDDVERFLVRRAVQLSWQLERADRALAARSAEARLEHDEHLADVAEEVAHLGRKLFWDPRGPLPLYPHVEHERRCLAPASWSQEKDDPDDPARLVIRLEATTLGCAWLLDRWAELRELLERGLAWLAPDRFKAIRLLGRQPLDAAEDDRVRTIYLACWAISPEGENAFADVKPELGAVRWERLLGGLERRESEGARPLDPASARAILLERIAAEEGRLETVLNQHLEREESSVTGLLFDQTPDGERLRRYQATCDRTLLRVLEMLRKRRREADRAPSAPRPPVVPKKPERPEDTMRGLRGRPDSLGATAGLATNEPNPSASEANATNEAIGPAASSGEGPLESGQTCPGESPASPARGSAGPQVASTTNEANALRSALRRAMGSSMAIFILIAWMACAALAAMLASGANIASDRPAATSLRPLSSPLRPMPATVSDAAYPLAPTPASRRLPAEIARHHKRYVRIDRNNPSRASI